MTAPAALLAQVETYLPPSEVEDIRRAFDFAAAAHDGQLRESGEPYITHPLAVAETLAELHLDSGTLMAALLHDVSEDCGVPLAELESRFGPEAAKLVDGVTKLSRVPWFQEDGHNDATPREHERPLDQQAIWAESMRKMFLAMADDVRVVLIKLADRLHNMRTLDARPPEKRRRVAQETMDIYAPLANRLGIWQIKWQLEDLSFRHLEPATYKEIAGKLAGRRVARERYIQRVIAHLDQELRRAGITAEISGRPKHIYSIYRKMRARSAEISQIFDLLAVRVLVDTVQECYSVLGQVHALWRPLPGQFDDYIANPKESLYQSLHTSVMALGHPLEIQIRTYEMHKVAEYGVAAHWRYKEGRPRDIRFDEKVAWLRQLMDWQKDVVGGAQAFVDSLKTDVFQDQVYVFTPKGEVKEMPAGATPLDFAYRVHTEVGHKCVGAKVNGRMVPLDHRLRSGDIVEVLTSRASKGPSRDWLNPNLGYLRTANAREKIRQWFRRQQRDENVQRGRELLEKELKRLSIEGTRLEDIAGTYRYERLDDFLAAVGYGDIHPHQVAVRVANEAREQAAREAPVLRPATASGNGGVRVSGVGDLLTRLARCCAPVPGDSITGYITRGKGVTVHRADCPSVAREQERERLVSVDWDRTDQQVFPVTIRVDAWDRVGLVRDVGALVADEGLSMSSVSTVVHKDQTATVLVTVEVSGLDKLSRVLNRLEGIRDVFSAVRDVGKQPVATR